MITLVSPEVSPGCFIQMSRFARLLILRISCKQESQEGQEKVFPMHRVQHCLGLTVSKL